MQVVNNKGEKRGSTGRGWDAARAEEEEVSDSFSPACFVCE
jgi:hypothetical protein